MELIWVLVGFFAFITLVFTTLAIFFPEWVGITGKKALEVQKHLQGASSEIDASKDYAVQDYSNGSGDKVQSTTDSSAQSASQPTALSTTKNKGSQT